MANTKLVFISSILVVMMAMMVSAMDCKYNQKPYLEDIPVVNQGNTIQWVCTLNSISPTNCLSYVRYLDILIQVNPTDDLLGQSINVSDSFLSTNGIVHPYFTDSNLRDNQTVTFGVKCANGEVFETNVTPTYKIPLQTGDTFAYLGNSGRIGFYLLAFIVTIAILIFIVLPLAYALFRWIFQGRVPKR